MPPLNSRRTELVAASFTYLSFVVAALKLLPHVLIRAHLPCPFKRCPSACCEQRYCRYCTQSGKCRAHTLCLESQSISRDW